MEKNKVKALLLASVLTIALITLLYGGGYILISWLNSQTNDSDSVINDSESTGTIYLAKIASINEESDLYSYDINYPVFAGSAAGVDEINSSIESIVNQIRTKFIANVNEFSSEYMGPDVPGESYLIIETINHASVGEYQSIELVVSEMYKGAAHPNNYINTVTYHTSTGDTVNVAELVSSTNPYEYLSNMVRMYFEEEVESDDQYPVDVNGDWFREGTAPRPENFQEFVVTKNGITIIFNPYQIAPYVAGALRAELPRE